MQSTLNIPVILAAVKQAGDFFLPGFKKVAIPPDKAGFLSQLTAIEDQCLGALRASLAADFPDTPWLSADFPETVAAGAVAPADYWLCDAMDGAVQYIQHVTGWTINVVLVREGRLHFAAIYDPLAQEMFWAREGGGAFLNDAPLKPSMKTDLALMLAVFEYPLGSAQVPGLNQQTGAAVTALLDQVGVVRNFGPHGLQLAYVGAGRIDLFYEQGADTENWLPGVLIAREAGAEVLTTAGQPWQWGDDSLLVATPGAGGQFLRAAAAAAATA